MIRKFENITIKKFEEFINEDYDGRILYGVEMFEYLENLGIDDKDLREIYKKSQKSGYYMAEEIDNILKRLPGCDTIEGITDALKTIFYGTDEDFKKWVGNIKCPVVRGVEGLLLSGDVYYFDKYDVYSGDAEDFFEYVYQYVEESDEYDNSILEEMDDADFIDFIEKLVDDDVITMINLDEKFGWEDDGSWEEKWKTSEFLHKRRY